MQVKIERSIETEPTGGAQGGVALAAAGGSGSMPAPDIGGSLDLSDPDHPHHNSWRSDETAGCPYPRTELDRVAAAAYGEPVSFELHAAQNIEHTTNARVCLACRHLLYRRKDPANGKVLLDG